MHTPQNVECASVPLNRMQNVRRRRLRATSDGKDNRKECKDREGFSA